MDDVGEGDLASVTDTVMINGEVYIFLLGVPPRRGSKMYTVTPFWTGHGPIDRHVEHPPFRDVRQP